MRRPRIKQKCQSPYSRCLQFSRLRSFDNAVLRPDFALARAFDREFPDFAELPLVARIRGHDPDARTPPDIECPSRAIPPLINRSPSSRSSPPYSIRSSKPFTRSRLDFHVEALPPFQVGLVVLIQSMNAPKRAPTESLSCFLLHGNPCDVAARQCPSRGLPEYRPWKSAG